MATDVRVVTPITTWGFRDKSEFAALERPDLTISHIEIETGPASIECEYDEALAVPGTIAKIIEAERDGCDAVVIDCMGDPGMLPGRECVSIPVIGPCEAAMHVASMLGHTFSVVTVLQAAAPAVRASGAALWRARKARFGPCRFDPGSGVGAGSRPYQGGACGGGGSGGRGGRRGCDHLRLHRHAGLRRGRAPRPARQGLRRAGDRPGARGRSSSPRAWWTPGSATARSPTSSPPAKPVVGYEIPPMTRFTRDAAE